MIEISSSELEIRDSTLNEVRISQGNFFISGLSGNIIILNNVKVANFHGSFISTFTSTLNLNNIHLVFSK